MQYHLYTILLYFEKRILLNTRIIIPPDFWNAKKLCISQDLPNQYGMADELNDSLWGIMRHVEDIISIANKRKLPDPGSFEKQTFNPKFYTFPLNIKQSDTDL